jgi:hypothetical protein
LVQLKVDFVDVAVATVAGGLFFAGFVEGVKWLAAKFSNIGQIFLGSGRCRSSEIRLSKSYSRHQ